GELLYDRNYAVSTLQAQLREQADLSGEEVLERRHDAWSRLLAIFRVVYGGVEHQDMRLRAYGGHLFDPDRYPFLEGRAPGTSWQDMPAEPLAINNRTVLHLLEALQFLQVKVPGGGPTERRRLSFRALDIEQIGHVYEGLLDHTARRATTAVLGLFGSIANESEVALEILEELAKRAATPGRAPTRDYLSPRQGPPTLDEGVRDLWDGRVVEEETGGVGEEKRLVDFLVEKTGRSLNAIKNALAVSPMPRRFSRADLMAVCDNNPALFERVLPFVGLLRTDTFDKPVVITAGSVYVTQGSDRRTTGTHYTPRSLTEPIVQHTLDPLVYIGPAEGKPQEEWQLRSAAEILELKVCDMAMGSGAFLVQVCRYLSEKLVESWENAEQSLPGKPQITPEGLPSTGALHETLLPRDPDERLAIATRLVSERCIYGVDKNPLAVEMAKLSLWLITLNKNRPFTFLDHALRCGDSLLGVNLRQLTTWSMDNVQGTGKPRQMAWFEPAITHALDTALKLRRQISAMQELDVHDIEAKARLLAEAEEAMELVKLGADLLIATALSDTKRRELLEGTIHVEYTVLVGVFEDGRHEKFTEAHWGKLRQDYKDMREEVDELLKGRRPFHWPLEFPEVFVGGLEEERGFAAIVSNPPFQGGKKITGSLGTDYRDYLLENLAYGKRGNADLCAYFFLRVSQLMCQKGQCGLLATNTIAQGDTREVGLDQIVNLGLVIPRAISSRKWPGIANLEVARVWLRLGDWRGEYLLDEKPVKGITPFLTPLEVKQGNPNPLLDNAGKSFQGNVVLGIGFVLRPEEAEALIEKDPRNREVLFPYLNGEDLNSHPEQSPSRWIINFQDWPLEQAETYSDCIKIVREKVKPERDRLGLKTDSSAKGYARLWWQYARKGLDLYASIAGMKQVLVKAQVSKTWGWALVPNGWVYDQKLVVFAFARSAELALLQSTLHWEWAIQYGATLRLDMSYTPTAIFETFPFPVNLNDLNPVGQRYNQHRQSIMLSRQEGLTKTYNRFHDPQETAEGIVHLRVLHKEMDEVVAKAYGWDDLDLEHGFHETKQGVRYTISEVARREVLGRLLKLNHERHAEEVAMGLHEKGAKKGKGKGQSKRSGKGKDVVEEQGELVFE
ncbi:MAG: Eco57I restriction-modification methylase domain-containing protein, partial [Ktedonobacteraceae bacterium]